MYCPCIAVAAKTLFLTLSLCYLQTDERRQRTLTCEFLSKSYDHYATAPLQYITPYITDINASTNSTIGCLFSQSGT